MGEPLTDDWSHRALCLGDDPETWFPVGETGPAVVQEARARLVCSMCPVRVACGEAALAREGSAGASSRYGIWGGLTPVERAAEARRRSRARTQGDPDPEPEPERAVKPARRRRAVAECGTPAGYARHVRLKSAYCEPCRRAKREADRRLRSTGSSRERAG